MIKLKQNKLEIISNLFEGVEIRSIWDSEKGDYYFSVIDVISVLSGTNIPKRYWSDLKRKLVAEGSQLYENIVRLKVMAKDGKLRDTDTLDTKGIFRLIESIPSPKAEPFKLWLANLGSERIEEVFDPEKAVTRAIAYYKKHGYDDAWIESRIKAIFNRNKLTSVWKEGGISEPVEYAILTNEIYQAWSGMKANEYKDFKGLHKESLRDNMTDLEILLADIGETTTRELAKTRKPQGLEENKEIARLGGKIANNTKKDIENVLQRPIIRKENKLNHDYPKERQIN